MPPGRVKALEVKVVLLGDTGVGKSSLVLRFAQDTFKPFSESTIGASFMSKTVSQCPSCAVRLLAKRSCPRPGQAKRSVFLPASADVSIARDLTAGDDGGGPSIKFQIWDTAGQEKYHSLAPSTCAL